jgi:hypothetical protein
LKKGPKRECGGTGGGRVFATRSGVVRRERAREGATHISRAYLPFLDDDNDEARHDLIQERHDRVNKCAALSPRTDKFCCYAQRRDHGN